MLDVFESQLFIFHTNHRLSADDAMKAIKEKFETMEVRATDKQVENLYVVKDELKIINLVRLSNIGEELEESKSGTEKAEKKPDRLLMEILGVEKATNDQIRLLQKLFEDTISSATMLKIAERSMRQSGLLQ